MHAARYFRGMPSLPPVSDTLKAAFAPSQFVEASHEAVDLLAQHLAQTQDRTAPSSFPRHRQWQSAAIGRITPRGLRGGMPFTEKWSRGPITCTTLDTWDTKWRRCFQKLR